jgi:hypothetical protein
MTFQADAGGFIRLALTHTVVFGCFLTVILFGSLWFGLFALSVLLLAPGLALLYVLVRRWRYVYLDDARGSVRLPLRSVPYDKISGLRVVATGDLLQITLRTGRWTKVPLLAAWGKEQGDALLEALRERCPDAPVRRRNIPWWASIGIPLAILSPCYLAFHFYLQGAYPWVNTSCQRVDWVISSDRFPQRPTYEVGGVRFSVPRGFEEVKPTPEASALQFQDPSSGSELVVTEGLFEGGLVSGGSQEREFGSINEWLISLLGVESGYDLVQWVYCSRFGTLPLVLKALILRRKGADDSSGILLYEWKNDRWQALIKVEGRSESRAEILMAEVPTRREIYLVLRQPGAIGEELLTDVVSRVVAP